MVTVEIVQSGNAQKDEPVVKETIEIEEVLPLHIIPVDMQLGSLMPITQISNLIAQIKTTEQPQQEERDRYYAQNVPVYGDGDLSLKKMELPHHIGLRVVLECVLQNYGKSDDLQIRIS